MLKIVSEVKENHVSIDVKADGANPEEFVIIASSIIFKTIEKIKEHPLLKLFGIPEEYIVDYVLDDIKEKLGCIEKEETQNAR